MSATNELDRIKWSLDFENQDDFGLQTNMTVLFAKKAIKRFQTSEGKSEDTRIPKKICDDVIFLISICTRSSKALTHPTDLRKYRKTSRNRRKKDLETRKYQNRQ